MRIHDDIHGWMRALKIGNKHFYFASRNLASDLLNRECEQLRTPILAIVAIHTRDNRVAESKHGTGLTYPAGLIVVHWKRSAFLHRAKSAAAGADISKNHKSCSAKIPAFADIRTCRALAHGMQLQPGDKVLQFPIVLAYRRRGAKPLWPLRLRSDGDQHSFSVAFQAL